MGSREQAVWPSPRPPRSHLSPRQYKRALVLRSSHHTGSSPILFFYLWPSLSVCAESESEGWGIGSGCAVCCESPQVPPPSTTPQYHPPSSTTHHHLADGPEASSLRTLHREQLARCGLCLLVFGTVVSCGSSPDDDITSPLPEASLLSYSP